MSDSLTETANKAFWRQRATQIGLGLSIALNLLLSALVLLTSQQLEQAIAGATGVDSFGAPSNALILPVIGLVSWVIGGALAYFYVSLRNEAPMATIIWGTVILIELATWVPVLNLLIDL